MKGVKGKASGAMADKEIELIPISPMHRPIEADDTISGKKRLAVVNAKRVPLARSSSMSLNAGKRAADQVMAIGLAPDGGHLENPAEARLQARLRAESKFTFRPDNLSDENELSPYQNVELDGLANEPEDDDEDQSDGLLGVSQRRPVTALHFFAREFHSTLERDYSELKTIQLSRAIKHRWDELSLK